MGLDAVLAGTDDAQPRFAGLAAGAGRWLSFAGMLVAVGALVVVINHPGGIHR